MQRRREQRYEVWESVVLTVLEQPQSKPSAATIVDISRSGYRVLSAVSLAVGSEVLVTLNSVAIIGRVRHCKPSGLHSFIGGVEITAVTGGVAERSSAATWSGAAVSRVSGAPPTV